MAVGPGRRDEILATFVRHVAMRGYEKANLGDIASELGMSKGTIVHHFGTKAQMLRELEDNYMTKRRREVALIWERITRPADRIAALIYAAVLYQVEERDATVASQREIVQLAEDPEMAKIRRHRRAVQDLMTAEIQAGVDSGEFRPVDATLATLQTFGAVQWMWTWFRPGSNYSIAEVGSSFVNVALGGLLTDQSSLPRLSDPEGEIPAIVQACMREAQKDSEQPEQLGA